jgi:hypothetical protein
MEEAKAMASNKVPLSSKAKSMRKIDVDKGQNTKNVSPQRGKSQRK